LDETEDALARVYNQVLRFVERDLKKIMEIAEKVSLRSVKGGGPVAKSLGPANEFSSVKGSGKDREKEGFEIMANVVWAQFGRAIMDEMGSVVFAAGRPGEFRKVICYIPHPFRPPLTGVR